MKRAKTTGPIAPLVACHVIMACFHTAFIAVPAGAA
jgi:hypothetical protein